jgi:hypothetical protein
MLARVFTLLGLGATLMMLRTIAHFEQDLLTTATAPSMAPEDQEPQITPVCTALLQRHRSNAHLYISRACIPCRYATWIANQIN